MKNNTKLKGKYGYTLLELVVVLALFAIILSISIPSMRAFFISMEKKELMELKRDLASARNSAIIENKTYYFGMNKRDNLYLIVEQDTVKKMNKKVELKSGLKIKNNNMNSLGNLANAIKFTPSGAPEVSGTILLVDSKGKEIKITITPATGKINIYKD